MRLLDFTYDLRLDFDQAVTRHAFQLRCVPPERNGQHVEQVRVCLLPDVSLSTGTDGFGNPVCFGMAEAPHTSFGVNVQGRVCLEEPFLTETEVQAAKYRPQTYFTQPGEAIQALYARTPHMEDPLEHALALMRTVRGEVAYVPASTTVTTRAEEAAAQGCGVCQDHTQIVLSLLRMAGIPCRYVAGLLLGEGRTHAWAEALIHGRWIGLDATNGTRVIDTHIVLAVGRDHTDCELNRGVMLGFGSQTQRVHVSVRPALYNIEEQENIDLCK